MNNKILNISIISVGIAFLCWYLPVAFYNVFACDDFWFGTNVRENGLFGNVLFYYYNWEGSYTHTFFASWPLAVHYSRMPFIGNMYSVLLFYSSLCVFFKIYTNLTIRRCLMCSMYLLAFIYLCTKGNAEIRFWICANVTFLSEVSFVILLLSLYHILDQGTTFLKWVFLFILSFLVGGSKLTIILYAFSSLIIHDILFNRKINRVSLIVFILIIFFVVLNVAAPGNYIRLDAETLPKEDGRMNIYESVIYRFIEMKPYLLNTLFLLPIAIQWNAKCIYEKKRIWLVLTVVLLTFLSDSIIMYVCFNDPGPLRVYFVAEVYLAILVVFLLNHFNSTVLNKYNYTKSISILLATMVAFSNVPMMFQVPDSIEFSNQSRKRDKYVETCNANDNLEISKLPQSYLMLSYFANDEIWIERVYLPYFQKNNKFVLK